MQILVYLIMPLFFFVPGVAESGQLADRVLVEIGSAFFTQHQLESYLVIKSGLSEKDWKAEYEAPSPANWEKLLRVFILDMVIQQEAQRLGSFFPSDDAVSRGIDKIHHLEKSDQSFSVIVRNLQIEKRVLVRTTAMALQVSAYSAGKLGEVDSSGSSSKRKMWQDDLLNKFVVRYLDGSKSYRPIYSHSDTKG